MIYRLLRYLSAALLAVGLATGITHSALNGQWLLLTWQGIAAVLGAAALLYAAEADR